MKAIYVYDNEADIIEKLANDNDVTEAHIIYYLLDYVDLKEFKKEFWLA